MRRCDSGQLSKSKNCANRRQRIGDSDSATATGQRRRGVTRTLKTPSSAHTNCVVCSSAHHSASARPRCNIAQRVAGASVASQATQSACDIAWHLHLAVQYSPATRRPTRGFAQRSSSPCNQCKQFPDLLVYLCTRCECARPTHFRTVVHTPLCTQQGSRRGRVTSTECRTQPGAAATRSCCDCPLRACAVTRRSNKTHATQPTQPTRRYTVQYL